MITVSRTMVSDETFASRDTPERNLAVAFVHEGLHTTRQEAVFKPLYDENKFWFADFHQPYYKQASEILYED